jgi:isoamylase
LPLGVTWIEEGQAFNFAVCAEHAESVKLLLYSTIDLAKPVLAFQLDPIRNKSGRIWHCRIPLDEMCNARYYGYSVSGQAIAGLRGFDHEKILFDPYAKRVFFPPGFDRKRAMRSGPNHAQAPLGVLPEHRNAFDWGGDVSPRPESDAISQFRCASIPSRNLHRLDRKDPIFEGPWGNRG